MGDVDSLSGGIKLSMSALAQEFGVSRDTVRRRLDKCGVMPDGARRGNPVFRLRDCIPALTQQSLADDVKNPKALPPMERRAWFASEKDRLVTEEKEGRLVLAEDHRDSLALVIQGTVQMLETMPDLLERDCDLAPKQVERIEQVIDVVRNRWADAIEQGD